MKQFSFPSVGAVALVAALLSGCATSITVDSQVQAFSSLTAVPAPATYKFDRLPSMQEPGQARVEAMADPALHKAGFRRDDAAARYAIQVTGRVQRIVSPWADPWAGPMFGGFGWAHRRGGRFGFGMDVESPWYHREAAVIVREAAGNKVVFESHAVHDGPWMDNTMVFPAMFEAALAGFPQPPAGARRVDITIAPAQSQ
ncbi:DUF4136 domain-containing protein [Caenimonas koreensis]|uniref:DUF4136 domain-containing protein n=1 Tax=Caenimonas koreensis DSM 17982 TaxID=1121255 RepID=A0A844ARY8_9BURK|nr:DUF4136 domain-containing protein [Caenimonas koreensis]MRD47045.1 DUF4136 domain-containing protein [Caenimonas koreensis DSM 17982]